MLARHCDQNEISIKFEYTSPGTLQQNRAVERAFVTLIGRGTAMMNHARFTVKKRQEMWCETAQTATMLENVLVQEKGGKLPHNKFYGEYPKCAKYLRTFGEIGVTAISSNKIGRTKLDPRGQISMFVGYSLDHPSDSYCLINLSTKRIIHSRDIIWLDKTWGHYYKIPTKYMVQEEIEIYEDNENQEPMPEEQEIQEQQISCEESEQEEGSIA